MPMALSVYKYCHCSWENLKHWRAVYAIGTIVLFQILMIYIEIFVLRLRQKAMPRNLIICIVAALICRHSTQCTRHCFNLRSLAHCGNSSINTNETFIREYAYRHVLIILICCTSFWSNSLTEILALDSMDYVWIFTNLWCICIIHIKCKQ